MDDALMISREDAADLKLAIDEAVKEIERRGFDRAHIGSAMAGIGLGIVQARNGNRTAMAVIEATKNALMANIDNSH